MIAYLKESLAKTPREPLGFFPTPFHRLERLSDLLGIHLYIKRDDFTGVSLFGGNKVRKLEFLIGDAIQNSYDTIITFGATQSNHVMETITACCKSGLKAIAYLEDLVDTSKDDLKGNLLLDTILGAEIHIVSDPDGNAMEKLYEMAHARAQALNAEGHKCYLIPIGGASDVGTIGYISGYMELRSQLEAAGISPDYLFTTTGSGGTLAGLLAGHAVCKDNFNIIAITAEDKPETYEAHVNTLAERALFALDINMTIEGKECTIDRGYFGEGYEIPSEAASEAIRLLAQTEGIFTDPVYTGKCFAGLIDYVKTGKIPQGSHVVFLHTGGTTALFAESKIIGSLAL